MYSLFQPKPLAQRGKHVNAYGRDRGVVAKPTTKLKIRPHLEFIQSESVGLRFGTCVKPINACSHVHYEISFRHLFN